MKKSIYIFFNFIYCVLCELPDCVVYVFSSLQCSSMYIGRLIRHSLPRNAAQKEIAFVTCQTLTKCSDNSVGVHDYRAVYENENRITFTFVI